MPTPLMPDEEFDALFRQGLEHSPEQPHSPAAWHRMDLLLDADLRQQALRRKLWRLLGAEALLVVLGMWGLVSAVLAQLPGTDTNQPALTKVAASLAPLQITATKEQPQAAAKAALTRRPLVSQRPPASAAISAPKVTASISRAASANAPVISAAPAGTTTRVQLTMRTATAKLNLPARTLTVVEATRSLRAQVAQSVAERQNPLGLSAQSRPQVARHHPASVVAAGISGTLAERAGEPDARPYATDKAASISRRRRGANQRLFFYPSQRFNQQLVDASEVANGRSAVDVATQASGLRSAAAASEKRLPDAAVPSRALRQVQAATEQPTADLVAATTSQPASQPIEELARRQATVALPLPLALPDAPMLVTRPASARPTDSLLPPRPLLSAYRVRLGVVAAPEFSNVRSAQLTTPGSNLGVQLDYQLARRWRLSTGYFYTNKIYIARGSDYHLPAGYVIPNNWVITNVDAVCRIVDIPLNLRYDVWQRPRYQVFASAGLSSLLMRREQYTYEYEPANGQPVPDYTWALRNGSQHLLKILNLSVGYERVLGQRWSVQAEPFVKLPLAGVGFGTVRLSSAGIFFSLKYGLLPVRPAPAHP